MADEELAPDSPKQEPTPEARASKRARRAREAFVKRLVSLTSGRRRLFRSFVLVEDRPEPPDPEIEEKKAQDAAEEKYRQEKNAFFESCTAERNRFIESKTDQSKTYDQTILTFSAGAIALSITFIEKLAPIPAAPWLLYTAWSFFGLAVLSVVLSFLVSQEAFQNEIEWVDASWEAVKSGETEPPERRPNRYTAQTRKLNFASGSLFVLGIVFFVLFGAFNWPQKKEASKITTTPIKIEISGEVMPGKMNVVTTAGAAIEIQKGNTPTPAMLNQPPQPPAQPAPPPGTPATQSTTTK